MASGTRGRPRRYVEYERLVENLPRKMNKRPTYLKGIGVFRGQRGDTVWVKIRLPHGATFKGRTYARGRSLECKLGDLSSWNWEQLEARRAELQGRADRGEPLEEKPTILFGFWATDWLDRAKTRVKAFETLKIHVLKHLMPTFGAKALESITTSDVNRWIALQLADLAPGTVKRQLNTFKAILNDAQKAGLLAASPCRNAEPIRGIVGRQRFLDGGELVRLLIAAEETAEWLPDLITWCVHSGMRKGEFRELLWSDIKVVSDDRQIAMIRSSKSDQPRMVECTQAMKAVLRQQWDRRVQGDARVFPLSKMTLRRKWEKARKAAGLEDVTMHDLRRTHSTHAAAAGVDLRTLAGRIGHTDLTMLQKHYAAVVGSSAVNRRGILTP